MQLLQQYYERAYSPPPDLKPRSNERGMRAFGAHLLIFVCIFIKHDSPDLSLSDQHITQSDRRKPPQNCLRQFMPGIIHKTSAHAPKAQRDSSYKAAHDYSQV